jgi:hypothetical protein
VSLRTRILTAVALAFACLLWFRLAVGSSYVARAIGASLRQMHLRVDPFGARPNTLRAPLEKLQALDAREIQRRLDQEMQFHRQTLVKAYDEVGRHSPKWDDNARRGLELAAEYYGSDPHRPGDAFERIPALLGAAIDAGCDDPLVAYVHARLTDNYGRHADGVADLRLAVSRLEQSPYSAFRRAVGLVFAADAIANLATKAKPASPEDRAERGQLLDRATALLPEALRDRTIPDRQIRMLFIELIYARHRLGMDRQQAYEALVPVLVQARGADAAVLPLIRGVMLTDYAWDARGGAWIDEVPGDKVALFSDRIDDAGRALAEAIAKDATDQSIGEDMMRVVLGRGNDDDDMSAWFEVARRLAPGSYEPYNSRRNSLLPRWGGSDEELLAFGRAAFARQEFGGSRASMVLVDIHEWIAKGPPKKPGYLERPAVCADYKLLYEAFLERYPESAFDRSHYVRRLVACQEWREADAQFTRLGDRATMSVFGGRKTYDAERALVADHLNADR